MSHNSRTCILTTTQPLPAHCVPPEKLLAPVNQKSAAPTPAAGAKPKVAEDLSKGKNLTAVQDNSEFEFFLREVIRQARPKFIVETGTYLGQGTTRIISSALQDNGLTAAKFYSVECNPDHHRQAVDNLGRAGLLPFVKPLLGVSVPRSLLPDAEAIRRETIENVSGEIFVDHHEGDRIQLYLKETDHPELPDDLLGQCLRECDGQPGLLLLDSAGHMGNVEFNYVLTLLRGPCYIALDDIRHVKHARSMEQLKADPRFEVLALTEEKFGSCLLKFDPAPQPKPSPLAGANRILFVRTDSIGDGVLASAMLEPLRKKFPQAKLAVLCQQHVAELFLACPFVDSVICYDRKKMDVPAEREQIISEITVFQPDVILNPVRSRDRLSDDLTLAYTAAKHVAIEGDLDNIAKTDHDAASARYECLIPSAGAHKIELDRHADFLRGLGIETLRLKPCVWTSPEDEALADVYFRQEKLDPQRTLALFPFTQHAIKDYPAFADALKDFAGWDILLLGGPETRGRCDQLAGQLAGNVRNLAGRTTLREMAALIRRCKILVGSDTCAPHIACAVGVPNVVVLGGGHFGRFMPYSPLTTAVSLPLDCFGCKWGCQFEQAHCVKDVAPEILAEAIRQTLLKNSLRPRLFLPSAEFWSNASGLPAWKNPVAMPEGLDVEIIEVAAGHCTAHTERSMNRPAEENGSGISRPNANASCSTKNPAAAGNVEIIGDGIPDPIVSVIVSTYASEKFMRPCLENLVRQTIFDRCEIIVVDSGSPQNERAVVAEFQQKHPNIRYVRTERETLYAAWNRSLGLARGRYWANANTDDSLRDDALEILVVAMGKHTECALAYADYAWTDKPNDTFPSSNILRTVKNPDYVPAVTLFYCITGCLQFWRTDALRQLGGFEASMRGAADYGATLRLMEAKMSALIVPEVLALFYQNRAGISQASDTSSKEMEILMNRARNTLDISRIFCVEPGRPAAAAHAWTALGNFAARFSVPWEDQMFEHVDFALACYQKALAADPDNKIAGLNLIRLYSRINRLNEPCESELVNRWPQMRKWIRLFRAGEVAELPPVKNAVAGPVYRPFELARRPTEEQLAQEPAALRPWICRIDGRHVYLSEELFPRPAGLRYQPQELQAGAKRLVALLAELPPFYAHFGGAGDALLLLSSFYDQSPDAVVFSHPNGVGAMKSLFDAFPRLSKIYFLPIHAEPFFHIMLRYAVQELRNCRGAGATPKDNYGDEWIAGLDLGKKYHVSKTPRWAAALRNNGNSRRVAVAAKGSLNGMVGSKRNLIPPALWPQILAHILERGFEPVILGVPSETKEYPALPGCVDARGESFPGQMKIIGQCAGLVGADSWAKTFSALAEIPTLVFEPVKGADLAGWKDPAEHVFIDPWPAIKLIRSFAEFCRAFDRHIAKVPGVEPQENPRPVISWEGSFLDHGSLSHVNRELVGALKDFSGAQIKCVTTGAAITADAMNHWPQLVREISWSAGSAAAVTVRHAWPPNWKRPASGKLAVIQPWEFGSLPKAWLEASVNVDEFWVPSNYVRQVYIASGVPAGKVFIVPNGVDPKKFYPQVAPMKLATQKKFKFLFVGGTIGRKGPDLLLKAYLQNFTAADDVCLVIKDFGGKNVYAGQTFEAQIRTVQSIPNAPEILYLNAELPPESLPGLYAACDCFVLPYRGEGFGLPVLEAMACGLPVMVTAGGATDDFVRDEFAWRIPAVQKEFGHEISGLKLVHAGWLLEPDLAVLGQQMRHVFANPAEAPERGQLASRHAHQFFSWKNSAIVVQQRISKLVGNHQLPAKLPRDLVKLPEVAHLGRLDEARELFAQKKFQAAWESTRIALTKRPFHPEAWLLLAEIALAAGSGKVAKQCAQRVRDLAPGWQAPKQFLARPLKGDAKFDWLDVSRITHHASRLSVCLIAKNEEQFLAQCLKSVRGLAAQIIVVDTGSTDRTVEIAKEFGAEIYSFAWSDDFAAARNAALEHATGDWILMLDADEELPAAQHAALLADLKKSGALAHRLPLANAGQNDGRSFVPRLFRNAPGVYYFGRIHEQVFPSLLPHCKNWGLKTALGTAEILHHGYTKEMVRDRNKIDRNLKLLRLALEENPADVNLVMNLGLELVRSDDLAGGVEKYREAFQMMSAQPAGDLVPELREVLLTQFTSQLYKVRAHAEVVEILHSPLARQGGLTASLHLALGLAQFELKQFSEAADQMRQCLTKRKQPALSPINTDIHTAAPQHCLALSLAKLGDAAGAEKAFQAGLAEPGGGEHLRLDYAKFLAAQNRFVDALHRLHEIVAHNPRQAAAWRLGGEITLGRPELLEFAREWTGEAFKSLPENSVLAEQCAEALLLNGDTAAALELWGKIWDRDPSPRTMAALILCEAVESPTTHAPDEGADELAASRAFIELYQKLIAVRALALAARINEQLDKLSRALPTAARMLESALQEAETPAEARAESGV